VVHREEAFGHRAAGPVLQLFQIADARGREMDPRPSDALGGQFVEPRCVASDRAAVVIPADRADVTLPEQVEHLVRPRIVADEVPRDPDAIGRDAVHVGEDRLERREIRMDIGEDRKAHLATQRSRSIFRFSMRGW
jgi:hypothetical protein